MRRVALPWPLLAIVLVGLVLLMAQGLRMASDRQDRLEPTSLAAEIPLPCELPAQPAEFEVRRNAPGSMVVLRRDCDEPWRLAILEELPERQTLRWAEPRPAAGALVLPLEGLRDGIYRIVTLPTGDLGAPREMDAPPTEWPVRARMLLQTEER